MFSLASSVLEEPVFLVPGTCLDVKGNVLVERVKYVYSDTQGGLNDGGNWHDAMPNPQTEVSQ